MWLAVIMFTMFTIFTIFLWHISMSRLANWLKIQPVNQSKQASMLVDMTH